MEERKTAPQERGAERMSFGELLTQCGYNPKTLSAVLNVGEDTVRKWTEGTEIPDAIQTMLIGTVLGCSLKTVYLSILRAGKS